MNDLAYNILIQKGLSNREAEVAVLVGSGLTNREVANNLFVTEQVIKFHLTNIYKKLYIKLRHELVVKVLGFKGLLTKV